MNCCVRVRHREMLSCCREIVSEDISDFEYTPLPKYPGKNDDNSNVMQLSTDASYNHTGKYMFM